MTRPSDNAAPFDVTELFSQYLAGQVAAHERGLGYPEAGDEAVPHDAVPVQPIDPALAWNDALAVAAHLGAGKARPAVPPAWPELVSRHEPAVALAFALGNFPQLVRHLHPLLTADPPALRVAEAAAEPAPALSEWAGRASDDAGRLLAAGALRLARQFDHAEELLALPVAPALQALHANEVAALAWHRGQHERAMALWEKQGDGPVARFNRGMASLFLGQRERAVSELSAAVAALPESSAWHHLGQL
jgi:hypothetical protein